MKRIIHIDLNKSDEIARPEGTAGLWVAEHPELLPEMTRIWAPCGCVQTILDEMSVLTGCDRENCEFSWERAKQALEDLEIATNLAVSKPDLTVN